MPARLRLRSAIYSIPAWLAEPTQAAGLFYGPAWTDAFSCQRLHRILGLQKPGQKLVLDGDALTLLARHPCTPYR